MVHMKLNVYSFGDKLNPGPDALQLKILHFRNIKLQELISTAPFTNTIFFIQLTGMMPPEHLKWVTKKQQSNIPPQHVPGDITNTTVSAECFYHCSILAHSLKLPDTAYRDKLLTFVFAAMSWISNGMNRMPHGCVYIGRIVGTIHPIEFSRSFFFTLWTKECNFYEMLDEMIGLRQKVQLVFGNTWWQAFFPSTRGFGKGLSRSHCCVHHRRYSTRATN